MFTVARRAKFKTEWGFLQNRCSYMSLTKVGHLSARGREEEEIDYGHLLGAWREPSRHLRPLGIRRIPVIFYHPEWE